VAFYFLKCYNHVQAIKREVYNLKSAFPTRYFLLGIPHRTQVRMESYLQYRGFGQRIKIRLENTRRDHLARKPEVENSTLDLEAPSNNWSILDDSLATHTTSLENFEDYANPRLELDEAVLQNVQTSYTVGTRLGISLTGIDVRSRKTHEGKELGSVFVVGFDGSDDPMDPHNWPLRRRIFATFNIGMIAWVVGMAASIDSPAIPQASAEFGVSDVAEALATGLVGLHSSYVFLRS
jgi:hypothetical protein